MPKSIEAIMAPKSVAVIGATNRIGSVGLAVFRNILDSGYQGVIYPVNPKARSIQGVKAYAHISEVPDEIDLAVIIVPAHVVPSTLEEAADKGVRGAVIITAGFKEVGGEGVELENKVKEVASRRGIRVVGPNCLGIINTNSKVSMNASFARINPKPGNIAFVSQSGALCTAALDVAAGRGIGFSRFISFGNKADVSEVDYLRYLKDDPDTQVILLYLEDISNGREFIEVCREITWEAKKPILAIKSGSSPEGAAAAASHTGSMAGSDSAYDAIFMQSGVQRRGIHQRAFQLRHRLLLPAGPGRRPHRHRDQRRRPRHHGHRRGRAPRPAAGPVPPRRPRNCSRSACPSTANIKNPVDVIGDAKHDRYEYALRWVMQDPNVDGAIVILTPPSHDRHSAHRPDRPQGRGQLPEADPFLLHGPGGRFRGREIPRIQRRAQLHLPAGRCKGHGIHGEVRQPAGPGEPPGQAHGPPTAKPPPRSSPKSWATTSARF